MKRSLICLLSALLVLCFVTPSFSVNMFTGYFSNDSIMTSLLQKGDRSISVNVESFSATEFYTGSHRWASIPSNGIKAYGWLEIPVRFSLGVMDNLSLRLTVPYISRNSGYYAGGFGDWGYNNQGLGDIRLEGLYQFVKESGSSPSIALNVGVKAASAQNAANSTVHQMALGTGSTDILISGIFKKDFGSYTGKGLIGYVFTGSVDYGNGFVDKPGDAIICSAACERPINPDMSIGGELWGYFAPKDNYKNTSSGDSGIADGTDVSDITLSPYVNYQLNKDVKLRGSIEIPIINVGTYSVANMELWGYKGVNITFGATWAL